MSIEAKDKRLDDLIAEAYTKNQGAMPQEYIDRDIAEISFKAGMKKVIDWVDQNHKEIINGWEGKNEVVGLDIEPEKWQDFKREWGIEEIKA